MLIRRNAEVVHVQKGWNPCYGRTVLIPEYNKPFLKWLFSSIPKAGMD